MHSYFYSSLRLFNMRRRLKYLATQKNQNMTKLHNQATVPLRNSSGVTPINRRNMLMKAEALA